MSSRLRWALGLALLASGCAGTPYRFPGPMGAVGRAPEPYGGVEPIAGPTGDEEPLQVSPTRAARRIAEEAEDALGIHRFRHDGDSFGYDCSGFVRYVHARAGYRLSGSSADLYERAGDLGVLHTRRSPVPGDVAFFEETYDRNGNGRVDDGITHVAIVTGVARDGTITLVHKGNSGVTRLVMNLKHRDLRDDGDGRVLNDWLRAASRRDPDGLRRLAGELWVGFASFWQADAARADAGPFPPWPVAGPLAGV